MSRKRDELLLRAGFIPANKAAELSGVTVQTIHRMVRDGRVEGQQLAGRSWYVRVRSLAGLYDSVPQIRDAILSVLPAASPEQIGSEG